MASETRRISNHPRDAESDLEFPRTRQPKPASDPPGTLTLDEIIRLKIPQRPRLIEKLLDPGEVALFVARQKEGKSTLALQLGIDVATGEPFLGRLDTACNTVLYLDYENRVHRLKRRGLDLARDRTVDSLYLKAFERISQRDVGLSGHDLGRLVQLVARLRPALLIIDPLRYAMPKTGYMTDEDWALKILEAVSELQKENPAMAVILVHHVRKQQDNGSRLLRTDPRCWMDRTFGSQALLAHVDTIWGLEEDIEGYTFATVPRSQDQLLLPLEKQPESEAFVLSSTRLPFTDAERGAWQRLPSEFVWTQALNLGIANSLLDRTIRRARAAGLITHDARTKRYRKVGI